MSGGGPVLGPKRLPFRERGRRKAAARALKAAVRDARLQDQRSRRARRTGWERLGRLFRRGGEHGAATRERLLEFVAEKFGDDAERAELVLWATARWALGQPDPVAAVNRQLNDAEEADARAPRVDPAWTPETEVERGNRYAAEDEAADDAEVAAMKEGEASC